MNSHLNQHTSHKQKSVQAHFSKSVFLKVQTKKKKKENIFSQYIVYPLRLGKAALTYVSVVHDWEYFL